MINREGHIEIYILLNQITMSSFAHRDLNFPSFGHVVDLFASQYQCC